MTNNELYYKDKPMSAIERVTLAEDIELPQLMKKSQKLRFKFLKKISLAGDYYKLAEQEYEDVTGKFYIQILTPTLTKSVGDPQQTDSTAVKATTKGNQLKTKNYKSSNYVEMTIPKYIVMNFKKKIPAGTEFLIASVGGDLDYNKMRIIGIYSTVSCDEDEEGSDYDYDESEETTEDECCCTSES